MSQFEPPTADNALLGFMLSVLAAVGCFGLFVYWLLQPTVLVNAGVDGYASKRASAAILTVVAADIETSAIALAQRENERQGLRPVALAAIQPSAAPAADPAPIAKASVKKRVVRRERWDDDWSSHRRDDWSSNRRSGWGSDNFGRRSSGGFGDWFR